MVEKLRKKAITLFLIFTCFIGFNFSDIDVKYFLGMINVAEGSPAQDVYYWPVPGHTKITREYNEKHKGIEIEARGNVSIVAVKDGNVIEAESKICEHVGNSNDYCCNNGMGNYVIIEHGNGLKSKYLHLRYDSVTVQKGDTVKAGDVLGLMGNSGRSEKQHLYFQLGYSSTNMIDTNPDKIKYIKTQIVDSKEKENSKWKVKPDVVLNIRNGVGVENEVVTTISENEEFLVAETRDYNGKKWGQVSYNGYIGWCSLEYAVKLPDQKKEEDDTLKVSVIEKEMCSLIYNPCGGKMDSCCRSYVKNSKITILDKPVRDGYIFAGWYANEDYTQLVSKGYVVENDMNLYACWTQ